MQACPASTSQPLAQQDRTVQKTKSRGPWVGTAYCCAAWYDHAVSARLSASQVDEWKGGCRQSTLLLR